MQGNFLGLSPDNGTKAPNKASTTSVFPNTLLKGTKTRGPPFWAQEPDPGVASSKSRAETQMFGTRARSMEPLAQTEPREPWYSQT
jgi:hypothetical protein